MNWQSIDTAPHDRPVLTFRDAGLMAVAEYLPEWEHSASAEWCCTDGMILMNVTHWMPLPEPPK